MGFYSGILKQMPITLYRRQRQILNFINQYIQKNGLAPSLRQIAESIGVSSLATIHEHLQILETKGVLKRFKGSIRGIKLADEWQVPYQTSGVELPILGFIAAGQPIEPYTDPNATLSVPPKMVSEKKPTFVLQVKGNSMIEDGILDGDFVVMEQQEEAKNGDIVVALLESGFATLKRYFKEASRIKLEPANSTVPPIYSTNVKIQGRLVGLIRKY